MLRWLIVTALFCYHAGNCDTESCKLNALSPYSYMVKLTAENSVVAHGTIFVARAILTTCSSFYAGKDLAYNSKIYASAGKVQVLTALKSQRALKCNQTRPVESFECHPKRFLNFPPNVDFDLAFAILESPFETDDLGFHPSLPFPLSPDHIAWMVKAKDRGNAEKCELIIFSDSYQIVPYEVDNPAATILPLKSCIFNFCCFESTKCNKYFEKNLNSSLNICAHSAVTLRLPDPGRRPNHAESIKWYKGAPLLCDGMTLGITVDLVSYAEACDISIDFFFMTTFIRSWDFMMDIRHRYTVVTQREIIIKEEDLLIGTVVTKPATATDGLPFDPTPIPEVYYKESPMEWYGATVNARQNQAAVREYSGVVLIIVVALGAVV